MKSLYFVLLPGYQALDLNGPLQVFDCSNRFGAQYSIHFTGLEQEVTSGQGLTSSKLTLFDTIRPQKGDYIFLPGVASQNFSMHYLQSLGEPFFEWLCQAAKKASICSICNAALIPAYAGLLDGKKCTTHWERFDQLQQMFPAIEVVRDVLFVKDENIYSSAGIASGIDLALSILEEDYGPRITLKVAREMVLYIRRDSGSSQHSPLLNFRNHINLNVHRVQDWIVQNLDREHSNDDLAELAHVSPRHLTRQFKQSTGITIREFTQRMRMERARELMDDPNLNITEVAEACGFGSVRQFRRVWNRYSRLRSS